jgi:hypothetical protein
LSLLWGFQHLQVIQPHSAGVKIEGASIGKRWLVVRQRARAQQSVVLHALPSDGAMPQQLGDGQVVQFEEAAYTLSGGEIWQLTWTVQCCCCCCCCSLDVAASLLSLLAAGLTDDLEIVQQLPLLLLLLLPGQTVHFRSVMPNHTLMLRCHCCLSCRLDR